MFIKRVWVDVQKSSIRSFQTSKAIKESGRKTIIKTFQNKKDRKAEAHTKSKKNVRHLEGRNFVAPAVSV